LGKFYIQDPMFSIRHLFIIIFFSFLALQLDAQNYGSWIESGKYEKTLSALNAALKKAPDDISLNYYKGMLYAQAANEIFNEDSSYKYYDRCLLLFPKIRNKEIREKLAHSGITPFNIKKAINAMLSKAYSKVEEKNTAEDFQTFFTKFRQAKQADLARQKYDMITFLKIATPGRTTGEYKSYLEANPDCACRMAIADTILYRIKKYSRLEDMRFFAANFEKHEEFLNIYYRLYNIIRKDGELLTLMKFYKGTPHIILTEFQKKDFNTAMDAYYLGLTSTLPSRSSCFGRSGFADEKNDELNKRLTREGAQTGDLQFSLMWNNYNDLDLHVIDPNGEEIFFMHKYSESGGRLDVDMNVLYKSGHFSAQPVENVFWRFGSAPPGRYSVFVVHYLNHQKEGCKDPTDYTVRVRCNGQDTLFNGSITYDYSKPHQLVFEFDYNIPEKYEQEFNDTIADQYDSYIKEAAPFELAWIAMLKVMAPDIRSANWNAALSRLSKYSSFYITDTIMRSRVRSLDKLLRDDRFPVVRQRLDNVNTTGEEYSPVLSADEKTLYFCGRSRKDNIGKEDIFISEYKNDTWQSAKPFDYINTTRENEAPLSVSADGNTILLFRSGDIYFAQKTATGWSQPQAFPEPVNTEYWEGDAMLTADGKAIIFASNRPGGENLNVEQNYYHGGSNYASDIYVCKRSGNGWGKPINIGKTVNTQYCERSPFLHPDLKTLYFSSDGHCGLGDLDVFMTRRLSDTSWTKWSKPVNLGRSINTADADWGYQVGTSGKWAYFAAKAVNSGTAEDICRFSLPDELRPEPVVVLTGSLSSQSGTPITATLHWVDLTSGDETGIATSDPRTGVYYILLPAGRHYGYYAESGTYFSVSDNLDLQNTEQYQVVSENMTLYQMDELVQTGEALRINNLFFDYDKSSLRQESFPELNRLAKIILDNPGIKVEIMGHTDDKGTDDYNKRLSEARAQEVFKYLVSKNIPPERMTAKGYGKSKPIVPNTSDENRQMNRRVEFRFSR
jgi:outer membrane protein OmpA-like peptidoglycan-associated protein